MCRRDHTGTQWRLTPATRQCFSTNCLLLLINFTKKVKWLVCSWWRQSLLWFSLTISERERKYFLIIHQKIFSWRQTTMNLKNTRIFHWCLNDMFWLHYCAKIPLFLWQNLWSGLMIRVSFLVSLHEPATFIAVTRPGVRGKMKWYEMEAIWFNLI